MEDWLAIAGLIFAGSISPGPNNALALRAGFSRNASDAAAVIGGVQFGCLILFVICWGGLTALLQAHPLFAPVLTLAGSTYLAWLGLVLLRGTDSSPEAVGRRFGFWSVTWLQFVNPKAWILVVTVTGATAGALQEWALVVALFITISVPSLLSWTMAGAQLSRWLSRPDQRLWFDRAMGILLIASAITLIASHFPGSVSSL